MSKYSCFFLSESSFRLGSGSFVLVDDEDVRPAGSLAGFPLAKFRKMESVGKGEADTFGLSSAASLRGLRLSAVVPADKADSKKACFSLLVILPLLIRLILS